MNNIQQNINCIKAPFNKSNVKNQNTDADELLNLGFLKGSSRRHPGTKL